MSRLLLCTLLTGLFVQQAQAYPLDGYADTGIRRVEGSRLAHEGVIQDVRQPPGALLPTAAVDLRLRDYPGLVLPEPDAELVGQVRQILDAEHIDSYAIALLDISDPDNPVYAEHRGDHRQNVGSVGKLLAALGLFEALAEAWPDNDERVAVLRNSELLADDFAHSDHHTIRVFDVPSRTLVRRPMQDGDRGSLWEYLDWTLSVSSNSTAAMVMRDAMMLKALGRDYPPPPERVSAFFSSRSRADLTALFQQTFWAPVSDNGLSLAEFRQGSFFTAGGKRRVDGGGNSYASARGLMKFALKMEQGGLVDDWSSLQLKRLLYMTERRIRYASAPELSDAAVYFKSGSLYRCQKEEGFTCHPYHGNVYNYMNSLAIVEDEVDGRRLHYIAVVLSNVLKRNGAVDHQTLGGAIHRLMRQRHTAPALAEEPAMAPSGPGH
ncbi:hypothetical protein [Parahaliea aestuarii]|uniref:Serine hydrolase n=1 Tax=Parahaliea aestuarii TaxID=1852021 RepID=A0A5C9A2C8_9GAMM|nr:hypothetical protein [Parahaliea aestuarii]TXS95033.1 hypothetical protein FVW59_03810 [Parahaliea aestuarii]